jgi:hypothetical protein
VLALLLLAASMTGFAQTQNKPFYDYSRRIHFGFTIGTNVSHFKYDLSPQWYHPANANKDTFLRVRSVGYPGLTIGAVANLHIGSNRSRLREHFDLRFIPSLVLSERHMVYTLNDNTDVEKKVESALVEFPFLMKFKSDRFGNLRFYAIGGFKYSLDLSSEAKATVSPANPRVAIKAHNIAFEYGTGLDLYFPFFKFSPEIKVSRGMNNVLVPANPPGTNIYTDIFSRFRSEFIFFSLYFEG